MSSGWNPDDETHEEDAPAVDPDGLDLATASPQDPTGPRTPGAPTSDEQTLAVLIHVLAMVSGIVAPLVIWLIKKDESPFVDHHGKETLNFWLTFTIVSIPVACIPFLGALVILLYVFFAWYLAIRAAIAASKGQRYRYPLTWRLIE